jgi:6-pyruvoyltetrahydropterin/6-carboxytetrahydropterin synthase
MFELSINGEIAAAHFLNAYDGKCKNLHGHTWKVEITVLGKELNSLGMVADFTVLKAKLKEVLEAMDHGCLNDLSFFKENNPTTENIARYLLREYGAKAAPLKVKNVRVWESDTSSVTYYED